MNAPDSRVENTVADPALERQGRRLARPGGRLLILGWILAVPGIVLILIGQTWSIGFGAALLLIGGVPGTVGAGLLVASAVTRWSARRKLFA